jgi:hypothetical protein
MGDEENPPNGAKIKIGKIGVYINSMGKLLKKPKGLKE